MYIELAFDLAIGFELNLSRLCGFRLSPPILALQ